MVELAEPQRSREAKPAGEGAPPQPGEALRRVWEACGPSLRRVAYVIVGDGATADDVVQEAFVRVWRRRDALERPESLQGYLRRAVRNLALDHLRRRETRGRALEGKAQTVDVAVELDLGAGEEAARVAAAVGELPAEQREVVALRVWEGLTFREVAEATGAPLGTVQSRFRYACQRLRSLLGPEGSDA